MRDVRDVRGDIHPTYSVNDVVFAATAGALRRYCLAQSASSGALDASRVRALTPLAFPRARSSTYLPTPTELVLTKATHLLWSS